MQNEAEQLQELYRTSSSQVRSAELTSEQAEVFYETFLSFVSTAASPPQRLLDVGCGAGWSTYLFAQRGYQATGIDLNPAAFEPPALPNLTLIGGSGTNLPFEDRTFDVAVSYQTLEHVPEPERFLTELLRVTQPGGTICIVGPNLLGLMGFVSAVAHYVWKNRPLSTILFRNASMPRHPFGNTLPECFGLFFLSVLRIVAKSFRQKPSFTMRRPDLRPPFHADNDSIYLCNPIDLVQFFRSNGCQIIRDTALGRGRWSRMLATGTFVVVRKP